MSSILYVSVGIISVAFAVLVYHVIKTLKTVQVTLESATSALIGVEKQMQEVSRETTELLHKTNRIADVLNEKAAKLDTVFESAKELGDSVGYVNESLRKATGVFVGKVEERSDQVASAVNIVSLAIEFFEKWRTRKRGQSTDSVEQLVTTKYS